MSGHRITADLQRADFDQADPGVGGTITAAGNWTVVELISAAAETIDGKRRVLADPVKSGQVLILTLKTDGGDLGVYNTTTKVNTSDNNLITLNTAGDTVVLTSVPNGTSGYRWIITANDTATTTTV